MKFRLAKKIVECKTPLSGNPQKLHEAKTVLVGAEYCYWLDDWIIVCSKKRKGLRK